MAINLKKKNFAKSTLGSSINNTDSTLTVASGDGTKFPQNGAFIAVIWGSTYSAPLDDVTREIVQATWSSGDSFTITRGQESTTASGWGSGSKIAHIITAGTISEIESEIATKASTSHTHATFFAYLDSSNVKLAGLSTEPTINALQGTNTTWEELNYPKSANKKAFWVIDAAKYNGGSLTVKIRWRSSQTSGNAKFNIAMASVASGAAVDIAMQANRAFTAVTTNATAEYLNESSLTFTPTSSEMLSSGLVKISIERDVTDTLNDELGVLSVSIVEA